MQSTSERAVYTAARSIRWARPSSDANWVMHACLDVAGFLQAGVSLKRYLSFSGEEASPSAFGLGTSRSQATFVCSLLSPVDCHESNWKTHILQGSCQNCLLQGVVQFGATQQVPPQRRIIISLAGRYNRTSDPESRLSCGQSTKYLLLLTSSSLAGR